MHPSREVKSTEKGFQGIRLCLSTSCSTSARHEIPECRNDAAELFGLPYAMLSSSAGKKDRYSCWTIVNLRFADDQRSNVPYFRSSPHHGKPAKWQPS